MANLSTISIERPVLATVISLVIVLFGLIGFTYLGVREYPNVNAPSVLVYTRYTGAGAGVVEAQVTAPLEGAINSIAGINVLSSESREGASYITVKFELGVDMERAVNDVRSKVSGALWLLPIGVSVPSIEKADADIQPFLYIGITGNRSLEELSRIASTYFQERMQTIPGVSNVYIWNERKYAMRLWMDPVKMAGFQLTPSDVLRAVKNENVELPAGKIRGKNIELTVRAMGRLKTVEDFRRMVIKEEGNSIVRFSDIGSVQLGAENEETDLEIDGKPGVAVAVVAQPGANIIEIADAVRQKLTQIKKDMPEDIIWRIERDASVYVRASVREVQQTVVVAFALVLLVIFAFLRDRRTTLIPVVTIPISLVGSFFLMYLLGFTINVLTMLGIVLAIGLVVDDAIVALENIYKKIEQGMPPKEAAKEGIGEVYFAIISTTVVLVAVFLPIIFLRGITGTLFKEFGVVVSGAVIISSFVALTLTPMMSARWLRKGPSTSAPDSRSGSFLNRLSEVYVRSLEGFLKRRWIAILLIPVIGFGIYYFRALIPEELAPLEDRSEFVFYAKGVEGATFSRMKEHAEKVTRFIRQEAPEARTLMSITSPDVSGSRSINILQQRVMLKDPSERDRTQQEIVGAMAPLTRQLIGLKTFVAQTPSVSGSGGGFPIELVVQAGEIGQLRKAVPILMQKLNAHPAFAFASCKLRFNKPEVRIEIDRDRAHSIGVSTQTIAEALQLGYSEFQFGHFIMDGKQYKVIGQVDQGARDEPADIKTLCVRTSKGKMVQLANLITLKEYSISPKLYRYNRYLSATINIQPNPGFALSESIAEVEKITDSVLDDSYNITLAGAAGELKESQAGSYVLLLLALSVVYLALAAQFESFIDPITIMVTVPLALLGALISLWLFDQTLNLFSQIGIVMLVGLVTKNGILIVEFANQHKRQGMDVKKAIIEASRSRLRPILMTGLSTVLGILPVAMAWGAGAESRKAMGIAIVGGMAFASLLTLYIAPAFYSYLSKKPKDQP